MQRDRSCLRPLLPSVLGPVRWVTNGGGRSVVRVGRWAAGQAELLYDWCVAESEQVQSVVRFERHRRELETGLIDPVMPKP